MTQNERLDFLINHLISEDNRYCNIVIPKNSEEKFNLFRSLVNVREPKQISSEFIKLQDDYLQERLTEINITDAYDLQAISNKLYLWQGDITTLKCDAIVNAANSAMLGCFVPCHNCIDNAIHTFSGVQLRLECNRIMKLQGHKEQTGAVVIGEGAVLSTAAGFTYAVERFEKYFSDFKQKYGFTDMYSGGFYPFETLEEYWAYWSRYIYINRYMDIPNDLYDMILSLVNGKDYFVITTNVDHCFQKACFDKKRLFYTPGDYGLLQCNMFR